MFTQDAPVAEDTDGRQTAQALLAILTHTVTYVSDDWQDTVVVMAGTIVTIDPIDRLVCHQEHHFHAEPYEYRVIA